MSSIICPCGSLIMHYTVKTHLGGGGADALAHTVLTLARVSGGLQLHTLETLPQGKNPRHPSHRRTGALQRYSEDHREMKILEDNMTQTLTLWLSSLQPVTIQTTLPWFPHLLNIILKLTKLKQIFVLQITT